MTTVTGAVLSGPLEGSIEPCCMWIFAKCQRASVGYKPPPWFAGQHVKFYMGVSNNQGPKHRPQLLGLFLVRTPTTGNPNFLKLPLLSATWWPQQLKPLAQSTVVRRSQAAMDILRVLSLLLLHAASSERIDRAALQHHDYDQHNASEMRVRHATSISVFQEGCPCLWDEKYPCSIKGSCSTRHKDCSGSRCCP